MTALKGIAVVMVAVLAAAGLAALAAVNPALVVAAIVILALPLLFRVRFLAGATALAILFSGSLQSISQVPAVGQADEVLTVLFLVVAVVSRLGKRLPLRRLPGGVPLLLFVLAGALSSAANAVPFGLAFMSAFLLLKGWLFAYALAQLDWDAAAVRSAVKFGGWTIFAAIVALAANFALGARWIELWNGAATFTTRFGLPALQGLFPNPLIAGNAMACAFLLVLTHGLTFGTTKRHWALLAGTAAGVGLSGRRTAILGTAAGGILAGLRLRAASTVVQVVLLAPIAIVVAWSTIEEAVNAAFSDYVERGDTAARTIMHRDMFNVAAEHFPFGAGFARYGSYLAGVEYSPEYTARGYDQIWGLSAARGNDSFLTDTQWPAVFGETGFIGALCAILAILMVLVFGWKNIKETDQVRRWLGTAVVGMGVVMLVASLGVPVFFGGAPPQAAFFAAVGILVAYASQDADSEALSAKKPRTRARR